MKLSRRQFTAMTIATVPFLGVAACSGAPGAVDDGPVTLTIGDMPSPKSAVARARFTEAVGQFQKDNPGITLEPAETTWDPQTFQALVAGGTMPTVMGLPFTETQAVIDRGQVADLTTQVKQTGLLDDLNPTTLEPAQNDAGNVFGIPTLVDAMGLIYNRALFSAAGLDPDAPPTTWAQVREYAAKITKATGSPGYLQISEGGSGGWIYAAQLYSYGGVVQNSAGDAVELDSPETRESLAALHGMFFDDRSMGSTVLYSIDSLLRDFAAGKVGMAITPIAAYEWINNTYDMDVSQIGAAAVPQAADAAHGTMLMGKVQMVNPRVSAAEIAAAVKWIDYYYLQTYLDQTRAVADAKARVADGGVVGLPAMSPLNDTAYEQYQTWIKPSINVDLTHFAGYVDELDQIPLVPEPRTRAQETYAVLGTLVQQVLGAKDVDYDQIIAEATSQIERVISQ